MSLVNIISAIGNNSSVYPLIVRDCGIEIPTKVAMTYNQNLKDSKQMANNAVRECAINEYGTSIVWLGGIPATEVIASWCIKKMGYNPKINMNLLKESSNQGLKYNIEKFKNVAPKEVEQMEKVLKNKSKYQKLMAGKFLFSTIVPTMIMGYFLPKANFALTEKIRTRQDAVKPLLESTLKSEQKYELGYNTPSFKGVSSTLANMSTVNKMALTDGGLTVGRVYTGRNKYEKFENGFKMIMSMFLNFVAPGLFAKGFGVITNKLFNTNVNLDPKLLDDKEFLQELNTLDIPNNNYIEYLDKNPKSTISELCKKYCGVKYLENGVRDPREYVDEKKIKDFLDEVKQFARTAQNSSNPTKFAKKALVAKSTNILANIALSSFLLSVTLPKITFILRKKITGSDAEPGLVR